MSKYISQPRQKLNAAFKNAAASANPTAIVNTAPAPTTDAITATSAKPRPTACANCGGRTSSKVASDFKRGLINFLKMNAYGVKCGPRSAPIAKTIAWKAIIQRLDVTRAVAKTRVVITADQRGPRASIETDIFTSFTFLAYGLWVLVFKVAN
jgi:hypothetical protein